MKNKQIQTNYSDLPVKLVDAICYFVAFNPGMTSLEVAKKVGRVMVTIQPTETLVNQVIEKEQDRIEELALGGVEAVKVGSLIRQLPYASIHGRVKFLHDMIDMGKDGYTVERMSPLGELVEVNVRDFRSALEATKQLTGLMDIVESITEEEEDGFFVDIS
jgi:hypothetical protein